MRVTAAPVASIHTAPVEPVDVLKFGSSVLREPADLPSVVSEIYRRTRAGGRVVAVVSAFAGETDRLWAEAASFGGGLASRHAPGLIGLGEMRAAYLLAMACDQSGLLAHVADAREIGLTAQGAIDDAEPSGVDVTALRAGLAAAEVLIVPGFVALAEDGAPVLLGRGGSDLTAVAIADALGAPRATLYKDVPGVFDRDPNIDGRRDPDALMYDALTWDAAAGVANQLVQPKSIAYAKARGLPIRVAALGAGAGTDIGPSGGAPLPLAPHRPIRVAVAGLGVVGEGAALRLLQAPGRYELVAALVSDANKPRSRQINPSIITTQIDRVIAARPDVVLDALSSAEAGAALTEAALSAGVSVVSANKQAVAENILRYHEIAADRGAAFVYSPSVGGGSAMVESARRAARRSAAEKTPVGAIDAVLNGTVNFILSEMGAGSSFEDALRTAQEAGFAEADPSADLSGDDARAKAAILAFEAYGVAPTNVSFDVAGLDADKASAMAAGGGVWRQVTRIEPDPQNPGAAKVIVAYRRVDEDAFLAGLVGEENALRVEGGGISCRGRGAGRTPTVESMLADLDDIARALAGPVHPSNDQ